MKILERIKNLFAHLKGRRPHKLPTGVSEFNEFAATIFKTYDLPDKPGYRQAIASMIQMLGPQTTHMPLIHFARAIRKAQANQVAFEIIQLVKEEYKRLEKEAHASPAQAEASDSVTQAAPADKITDDVTPQPQRTQSNLVS